MADLKQLTLAGAAMDVPAALNDLSDVNAPSPVAGQLLTFTGDGWAARAQSSVVGDNYLTSEQVVGTWIDGKPIYQKTIVHTKTTQQVMKAKQWTSLPIPGVPRASEVDTLVESALVNRLLLENPPGNSVMSISYYLSANGGLYYFADSEFAWTQLILTLRYTKRGD